MDDSHFHDPSSFLCHEPGPNHGNKRGIMSLFCVALVAFHTTQYIGLIAFDLSTLYVYQLL